MYMKIEGMYIEFRVLIGMVIYDFIWFENVVVRSSIILWIIISWINIFIFVISGMNNLEVLCFVMGMNKNDGELKEIVDEIKVFLCGREIIVLIINELDLVNVSIIY